VISGGIVSYHVPEDTSREPGQDLSDSSYDGIRRDGELVGGLGQLVDGEVGGDNFRLDIGYGKGEYTVLLPVERSAYLEARSVNKLPRLSRLLSLFIFFESNRVNNNSNT
jgi:hypothetical protein